MNDIIMIDEQEKSKWSEGESVLFLLRELYLGELNDDNFLSDMFEIGSISNN